MFKYLRGGDTETRYTYLGGTVMDAFVTDMDGVITYNGDGGSVFEPVITAVFSDALRTGPAYVKELAGFTQPEPDVEPVEDYLDKAEYTGIVSARRAWQRSQDVTQNVLDQIEHEFDMVCLAGYDMVEDEYVRDDPAAWWEWFAQPGQCKAAVLEEVSTAFDEVVYADDAINCLEAARTVEGVTCLDEELAEYLPEPRRV